MTKWKMVPVDPTDEMLTAARDWSDAKYGKPIGNDATCGCYAAVTGAAPSPWSPLDPSSPGHKLPTAENASPLGMVELTNEYGDRVLWDWRHVYSVFPIYTHWAPCQPGPEERSVTTTGGA